MNWKDFALRLVGLIAIAIAAGPLYAVVVNLLLKAGQIPADLVDKAYGTTLITQCVYVWITCLPLGFLAIFLKENWRYLLYFSPLYAPSLYAIIQTILL